MGSFGHASSWTPRTETTLGGDLGAPQADVQLAPSFTGLTMALQGECEGRGALRQTGRAGMGGDQGRSRGRDKLVGHARPGVGGVAFHGTGDLDMSTPPLAWWPEVPAGDFAAPQARPRRRHVRWDPGMVLPELEGSPRWTHGGHLKARHTNCRVQDPSKKTS